MEIVLFRGAIPDDARTLLSKGGSERAVWFLVNGLRHRHHQRLNSVYILILSSQV